MNRTRQTHHQQAGSNISAGHFRLGQGVHVQSQGNESIALCDYPLRATKLTPTVAELLSRCEEEHTCEELALLLTMPIARVEALCDQLRWKSLLDAGPPQLSGIWPNVSIVIPSYNRAHDLERCVRSLLTLTYPLHLLEIVVVDDASTDETCERLNRLISELSAHGISLRTIRHEQQRGVAIARNTGTQVASHDIVAYIDSDCVASPGWLTNLIPYLQDARVVMVGGEIRAYDCTTPTGRYEDVRSSLYMGTRTQLVRREGPLAYLPTANLLIRKAAWQQLHGFEPLIQGEDVDFCRRLLATGARILYVPHGTVYHDYRTRLREFLGIRTAYASAEAPLLKRHPTKRRVLVLPPEQASFAGLALGALWGLIRLARKLWMTRRNRPLWSPMNSLILIFTLIVACLLLLLMGTYHRQRKLQQQHIHFIPVRTVFGATSRGHLAYTYHLCRHLTRYYTLPMLLVGLLMPPLLPLAMVICGIVIGVDYVRLKPDINFGQYMLYSLLDDCAYEWGVVKGCMKEKTWKALWPIVKSHV